MIALILEHVVEVAGARLLILLVLIDQKRAQNKLVEPGKVVSTRPLLALTVLLGGELIALRHRLLIVVDEWLAHLR